MNPTVAEVRDGVNHLPVNRPDPVRHMEVSA
ncbi:hypothetical protein BCF44_108437 [Kutzneria buriramensis]|uniref:Uncharacterized protein n=1 Tax=Kutzneria buriramensis TaxID=1045776 RepID=A0A3E0HHW9_9PSEU|nr:hypothetical protein BCF44_108437 [Kutzneria buriramensis]